MVPKVSVSLAVYNGQRYLSDAIDSILGQTFPDFELIIINDGSTDKTQNIIDSYKDPRIVVIKNESNLGVVASWNKVIAAARGIYMAVQDSDDKSYPERFSKQVKLLDENPEVGIVSSFFIFSDRRGKDFYAGFPPSDNISIQKELISEFNLCHGALMFRSEHVKKVGGYRKELSLSEDHDLVLRVTEISQIRNIPEVLYSYRLNLDSVSLKRRCEQRIVGDLVVELARERRAYGKDRLQSGKNQEVLDFLKQENERRRCKTRKVRSYAYFWWAFHLRRKKCFSYAMSFLLRAILIYPFDFRYWKLLVLIILKKETLS